MGNEMANAERVTVGSSFGNASDADAAACSGHIFDDHGLAKRNLDTITEDTGERVRRPARRERRDDCDRARRIVLG